VATGHSRPQLVGEDHARRFASRMTRRFFSASFVRMSRMQLRCAGGVYMYVAGITSDAPYVHCPN